MPRPKLERFGCQFKIGKSLDGLFKCVDLMDIFAHFLDQPIIPAAHEFCNQLIEHLKGFLCDFAPIGIWGLTRSVAILSGDDSHSGRD